MNKPTPTKISLKAKKPTIALSTTERILGQVLKMGLPDTPDADFLVDLARDSFFANYQSKPHTVVEEAVSEDRKLNKLIMDWALGANNWNNASTRRNLPASLRSSGLMWAALTSDAALADAIEKMRQAEKKKKEAEDLMEQAGQHAKDGDMPGYVNLMSQAQAKDEEADKLSQQAQKSLKRTQKDPLAQGVVESAVKDANDEARKVSGVMAGWGLDPASITSVEDAESIIEFSQNDVMKRLADLVGRAKNTASSQIQETKQSMVTQVIEHQYTKDLRMMTVASRMKLSPQAPDLTRFRAIKQWQDTGLFGFRPKTSKHGRGKTIMIFDESGSMGTRGCQMAKAMGMGIVQGIREHLDSDRFYELWGFSSGHWKGSDRWGGRPNTNAELVYGTFPSVTSKDGWREHLDWCNKFMGSGTDFDAALTLALERLENAKELGYDGVDLTIISDGIYGLSDAVRSQYLALRSTLSIKCVFFQFGEYDNPMKDLVDVYYKMPDVYSMDADKLIKEVAKLTTEHFMDGYGMGGGGSD